MEHNILGRRLRNLRTEYRESCEEVATKLGLSRSTLNHYELGRRIPGVEELLKLAKHYGVSVSYLIGETDKRDTAVYHADVNGHDVAITYKPGSIDHEFSYEDALKVVEKLKSIGFNVDDLLK